MTQDEIERVYDDFLYDCYIANKQLTPEDWVEYGRERHHMEIPARDNGVLTPLNAQDLTSHQHWVAGILQSEVRQKKCFFHVPEGKLGKTLENLMKKWVRHHNSESGVLGYKLGIDSMSQEEKQLALRRAAEAKYRPLILTTPEGEEVWYPSPCYAAREHGLNSTHLTAVCRGRRRHHKGFTARYSD
jgi:hypothetical protein